jgi:3-methyladenine DNA glycosylase AlkD
MTTTVSDYYEYARSIFAEKGNEEIAQGQAAYMKYNFSYFGLKAPVWTALSKAIFIEKGVFSGEDLMDFVNICFEDDHREMHYLALEMVQKVIKKQDENFIDFITFVLSTKSWWDSVDWIAPKLAGEHFKRFPHLITPVTEQWMASGNKWLQRSAIIFQLKYREKTDFDLLSKYILEIAGSKEFFLQKGAGWALREYSKRNPSTVMDFVAKNPQLSNLTKREATRLIIAKNLNKI